MQKFDSITFITGNKNKAKQVAEYLEFPVEYVSLDLPEIQSLDLREIVDHKVREAYHQVQKPVLVEDVSLSFAAFGKLPGPLIKWFLKEIGNEKLCRMLNSFLDHSATASIVYGLFDGDQVEFFEGEVVGSIAQAPRGVHGFGFDAIFVPNGFERTRAEMSEKDYEQTSPRRIALKRLESFLKL